MSLEQQGHEVVPADDARMTHLLCPRDCQTVNMYRGVLRRAVIVHETSGELEGYRRMDSPLKGFKVAFSAHFMQLAEQY